MPWLRERFADLVLLWVAGGFGMLGVELLLTGHIKEGQLIGVLASAGGVLVALLALAAPRMRITWWVGFLVVALSGLFGTALHLHEGAEAADEVGEVALASARYDGEGVGRVHTQQPAPPPLAPLGLYGLGVLGGLALYAREEEG